jgi:septal ring factor EnvC (AmiA/AmiB activator)
MHSRVLELHGEYEQEPADLKSSLQQQIAAFCTKRAPAQQQLAELDCKISKLEEQLGQLQAAEDQAAIDATASQEQDSEDLEMITIRSQSQRRRHGRWLARKKAASAVVAVAATTTAMQPSLPQLEELEEPEELELEEPEELEELQVQHVV